MRNAHPRILLLLSFLLLSFNNGYAQKKVDKKTIKRLKADIEYLASDELEGRRTGSKGEQKAAAYIETRYKKEKIAPYKGQYQHEFQFVYGREISEGTIIRIGNTPMDFTKNAFPLPYSANTDERVYHSVLPDVYEQGNIWLMPLYGEQEEANDAHFDYEKVMYDKAKDAKQQGAAAVIFYDGFGAKYPPRFNALSDFDPLDIPVVFLSNSAFETFVRNREAGVPVELRINIKKTNYTGTNVAAYIDNKAPYTVVIGAHYDHLGYGDHGSSLYAGKDKQIHNGADDNASGTAGLLDLASRIKNDNLKGHNYLFINFSGEELGLLGSKAFVKDMKIDSSKVAYMINMDMVGRLNDSTHALTIGGVGTSPVWGKFITKANKEFKIAIDSSGVGPSDHTSFYHAGIPVLFFFTGIHHDYHKPGDDADKINYLGEVKVLNYAYNIVKSLDKQPKPAFTPTKQSTVGKVRFKVTLGIMPDYSFQEGGVRIDGVSDGKPAMRAGIKAGDIIVQLGDYKIQGMQTYMEALGKFKSGETVEAVVIREGKQIKMNVTF